MIIPPQVLSIVGIAIIGHIGNNLIVSMGGKNFAIFFTIILDVAAAVVSLKWVWDKVGEIAHTFGVML
ncbi:hypothetical protein ACFPES_03175 [Paenibacillus sp. GCM10023248]|uniref:hypothetical protein n=1 Tax=Bacillales TaxID=1385 RepID=UPI002379DB17|nr:MULTISPECIES: hypothetical protein [Bacillales]MDD9266027.1 hypothetical protein [Paenibacillus sp. MAHUQ-63]MDR6883088.1 hypothetical protein [Bacillus sp. 3255]